MSLRNNILLITDEQDFSSKLYEKLVLLREKDSLYTLSYEEASKQAKTIEAKVIILHEHEIKNKTLNLIVDLKELDKDKNRSLILAAESKDRDFILSAYDEGVCEHFYTSDVDFEVLLRLLNCIKNNIVKSCYNRDKNIMEKVGLIDEDTGLYKYKYAELIINEELDKTKNNGIFLALSPEENGKSTFSLLKMTTALKSSVRCDDIVIHANGMKFYIYLKNTDLHGAAVVLNKIKDIYDSEYKIKAGICDVKYKDFERVERDALSALGEALLTNEEFVFYQDKEPDGEDWVVEEPENTSNKNFKLFHQTYQKKLERVIIPVFFRLQKAYEERLFNTKVEQYTEENKSVFRLKNENQTSTLKVIYPGFAKVLIQITHEGLNTPENQEMTLPLKQIDQKLLVSIVESFIKEFKSTL